MQPLDLNTLPLEGYALIEASAGTGKTYTLVNVCLRLLLETPPGRERPYYIEEILMVTFTEAATQELGDRLRKNLKQALKAFSEPDSPADALLTALRQRLPQDLSIHALHRALRDIDLARISTIHAFCQQTLARHALRSQSPFQVELLEDQSHYLLQAIEDYWRNSLYPADPLWAQQILEQGWSPECLMNTIRPWVDIPDLEVLPAVPDHSPELVTVRHLQATVTQTFQAVQSQWKAERDTIIACLERGTHELNGNSYRFKNATDWYDDVDQFLSGTAKIATDTTYLRQFRSSKLNNSVKKNCVPSIANSHPFFAQVESLYQASETLRQTQQQFLLRWQHQLGKEVQHRLAQGKRHRNQRSLHDLLKDLAQALADQESGPRLAQAIHQELPVALIDEFQDTDPLQYAIFSTLYRGYPADHPGHLRHTPQGTLYLIGDPKQSIYGFRGADLNTYLRAKQAIPPSGHYTLPTNYRSQGDYLQAVEALFTHATEGQPFAVPDIDFVSVSAVPGKRGLQSNTAQAPLQLWLLNDNPEQKLKARTAQRRIPPAVAQEIVSLLHQGHNGDLQLPEQGRYRSLAAGDIAVLVRKHSQGKAIRDALMAVQVPCVLHTEENVFATAEAADLVLILTAVLNPHRMAHLSAALATATFGHTAASLYQLQHNEREWESYAEHFERHRQVWLREGFAALWQTLEQTHTLYQQLLPLPDGERRVTNLRQLADILQAESQRSSIGPQQLLDWLAGQHHNPQKDAQNRLLQLDTDRAAVQILTIHKSKGLEYPIVFCPYLWDALQISSPPRYTGEKHPIVHLSSEPDASALERSKTKAQAEQQQEELRLAYVALTRAQYRAYVVCGRTGMAKKHAALMHLLPGKDIAEMLSKLSSAASQWPQLWQVIPLPKSVAMNPWQPQQSAHPTPLQTAKKPHPLGPVPQLSSFTALTARGALDSHLAEQQDELDTETLITPQQEKAPEGLNILTFPRGKDAGTFLHRLFEVLPFQVKDTATFTERVTRLTQRWGYASEWAPPLCTMLQEVWDTPIPHDTGFWHLGALRWHQRLNELEFFFPVQSLSPEALQTAFEDSPWAHLPRLQFMPFQGMMKGYMDLVAEHEERYFVVDYKSNYLGPQRSDYGPAQLESVMGESHYVLQYHLYIVALHRYLQQRLPKYDYDTHVGGAAYLFLRGMHPDAPGCGVFTDKPQRALIERLSALFTEAAHGQ
jgi:exodeoxyribonuclease V beta subunit